MKKNQPTTQSTEPIVKGYKVTDPDMACRGYKYALNQKFTHKGSISMCGSGFHFCKLAADCFDYYSFDSSNRVFEVHASGKMLEEGNKTCAEHIEFVRELTWLEVLTLVNSGKDNTGRSNSGDSNSGDSNSGNWNSGDRNSGYSNSGDSNSGDRNSGNWNSGNWNSGDSNSGDRNSGYWNSGNWNSGDRNSGDSNSGDRNSGDRNSGDSNSGDRNSGYRNSGYRNSGDRNSGNSNSGDRNSGDSNSGYRNSGNWNSGDRNSGDSNSGYRNSGAFCTDKNPMLVLFDKVSSMTVKQWENHPVCQMMYSVEPTIWVPMSIMTEEEKKANPKYETTEGYLKKISMHEAWANAWHNWSDDKKQQFYDLEHFDAKKFEEITGLKVKPTKAKK